MVIEFINLKKIIGKPSISDQFKKMIKFYKTVGFSMDTNVSCNSLHACL